MDARVESRTLRNPRPPARSFKPAALEALEDALEADPTSIQALWRLENHHRARRNLPRYLRNVAIALGNRGEEDATHILLKALKDEEPLIRIAAKWALGEIKQGETE